MIDASIYNNVNPVKMVDPMESMSKAMTLSNLAKQGKIADQQMAGNEMQQKNMQMQMDQKLQDQNYTNHLRKASVLGNALESMAAIPDTQKAQAWTIVRNQLVNSGVLGANDAPEAFNKGFFNQHLSAFRQTSESIDMQLKRAQILKAKAEASSSGNKNMMEMSKNLRQERSNLPTSKSSQEVSAAYNKIQLATQDPSPAGDLAVIFNFMKMLDPGSTVREGEFANAENSTSVPNSVRIKYNKMITGLRLGEKESSEMRKDFLNQSHNLYKAQLSQQKKVDDDFRKLAKKHGIDPNDVIINFGADVTTPGDGQSPQPQGGMIKNATASERPVFENMSDEDLIKYIGGGN